jgi:coenzyme F420-reducing hydrogenase delta subunit
MIANRSEAHVAVFFCRQLDPEQDANRRSLEKELGSGIRFFPMPCSGRIEALHLLKALETGARKVYLITCPQGACRYGQGNVRARKRLDYAKSLIREIGLSDDCFEMIVAQGPLPLSIGDLARELLGRTADEPDSSKEKQAGTNPAAYLAK